jgi:protein SCO1
MEPVGGSPRWLVFGLVFALTLLMLGGIWALQKDSKRPDVILETYGRKLEDSVSADGEHHEVVKIHTIRPFSLTDQLGRPFTLDKVRGKIYVADFFFTTCQSICIPMGRNMGKLVEQFKEQPDVLFVSHTVDPETDSVPVLKAYSDQKNAPTDRWFMLTGSKKVIYDLARFDYFVTATEGDGGADDFVHTQNFALIDTQGRIRGYYDGTKEEEVAKLAKDIAILQQETAL